MSTIKVTLIIFVLFILNAAIYITFNKQVPPERTELPLPAMSDYTERLSVFKEMENIKILGGGQ